MSSVRLAREPLSDALMAEMVPLLYDHWKEVARYPDIELAPNLEFYRLSEENGVVRVFTARRGSDLIGYAVFFVRPAPHYRHSIQAAQDILYLDPRERGTVGVRLIRFCELQLALEGVQVIMHHAKANAKHSLASILERLGYETVDVIQVKRLDTPATLGCRIARSRPIAQTVTV